MRYQPTVDIWTLDDTARAMLQPGQWVTAGKGGAKGRFMGMGRYSTVVAWLGNARGWRNMPGGMPEYFRRLREYAISVKES